MLATNLGGNPESKWSAVEITFDQIDAPYNGMHPGYFPIVVSPLIKNSRVFQVLIDRRSSLNFINVTIFEALRVPCGAITPSHYPFYEIGPGMIALPVGLITLSVTFGDPDNFQTELMAFEVVDFKIAYNDILKRPAPAMFMCIPHYVYQLLKMPRPQGVIMIRGDLES